MAAHSCPGSGKPWALPSTGAVRNISRPTGACAWSLNPDAWPAWPEHQDHPRCSATALRGRGFTCALLIEPVCVSAL